MGLLWLIIARELQELAWNLGARSCPDEAP
jgi:hypothetical protein